jgi:CrcB protein
MADVQGETSMHQTIAIAAGGALGALLRYWVSNGIYLLLGRGFPYGTLAVNIFGSFIMGLLFVFLLERSALAPEWRAFLLVGVLGAFTTFSTFSIETLVLLQQGALGKAALNMMLSVLLCVGFAWVGLIIGRSL